MVTAKGRYGFTVIELLVVISIMVLMISMGVVSFNALTGSDLDNASRTFVTTCNSAQQLAISTGLPVGVYIVDTDQSPWFGDNDVDADFVKLVPFKLVTGDDAADKGRYFLYLDESDIRASKPLPMSVRYTYYPGMDDTDTIYDVIEVGNGGIPSTDLERKMLKYQPDGSCDSPMPNANLPWSETSGNPTREKNYVILQEQTTLQQALIYVYPSTGMIKERIF